MKCLFNRCFILLVGVGIFIINPLSAQKKDSIKTVVIKDRSEKNITVQGMDSLERKSSETNTLTDLLMQNSHVQIKNYGLSSLSTLSIRGSSVAQTNVQWNGISIQNAMLGLADISLLPTSFFEQIEMGYGHQASKSSQSVIGGTLYLQNKLSFRDSNSWSYDAFIQGESFLNERMGVQTKFQSPKTTFAIKFLQNAGRNEYRYFNTYNNLYEHIREANNSQQQIMLDVSRRIRANSKMEAHFWYINNQREIPATVFEQASFKKEKNQIFRSVVNFSSTYEKINFSSTLGFTQDLFDYTDDFISLSSMATLYRIPFHVRTQYEPIKNLFFSLNMNGEYTQMNSNDKSYPMQRAWATCLLEKKKLFKRLDILAYVNAEKNSLFAVPITYGADVLFDTDKDILLYAKYTKSYRVPTLNELYYFPGGNEQLKPERAESLEGGFSAEKKLGGLFLTNQFSAFSRKVNDWILWRGAAIFFPDNIAFVKSRGLENETKCRFNIGYTKQQSSLLYSYTLSTSEKSNFVGDSSLGKQIPYVPRYSVRFNHGVTWKNLFVQWQQAYVSYRFTTTDESQFLLPYHLSNLFAQYKWHLKKHAFSGQIHLNNLFNTNYESMRGRIMPRRNLAVGFIWSKV